MVNEEEYEEYCKTGKLKRSETDIYGKKKDIVGKTLNYLSNIKIIIKIPSF